ncbi:PucR family transcriptional regulator [Leucobacter chromiireducens]|uniref:PucR family transcriptional regulator n=1 Tax=Leucobacter chromiireducens subsp. solipictus TaxID=398235 RepID=A0ABS1SJI8_9MICO|nr:PucR family transcriptional regulator [Leucobacter chromiireducens]MBL3680541.1 PucR family transcriptional regulator [Leucobacter chromiireducens subsp. solipictus]
MANSSGAHAELERLRTTLDLTNALLAAVSSTDPVHALTARMATLCHGTAIIYDFEGAVVASTGEAPTQLIWNEVSGTHQRELTLDIGRWHVRTRRVSLRAGVHVIAIASRGAGTIAATGEQLLDTSERLLGAVHGIQYGATQRDRRDNEQLIAALHDGVVPAREHRFWSRLAQFRFPAYSPVRALEFAPFDGASANDTQLAQLIGRARSDDVPLLIMLRRVDMDSPATIAALVPESPESDHWIAEVSRLFLTGVSAPFASLSRVSEGVREAETALGIARQWAGAADAPAALGPVLIDRIDLATWLLSHVDPRQLEARIAATLAPISSPQLRDTLVTYFAAEQNIARTAEALFVHPNTIRYRLARVEEETGQAVSSAFAAANLILALYPELIGRWSALRGPSGSPGLTRRGPHGPTGDSSPVP